jgi:hypothetical protein
MVIADPCDGCPREDGFDFEAPQFVVAKRSRECGLFVATARRGPRGDVGGGGGEVVHEDAVGPRDSLAVIGKNPSVQYKVIRL